MAAAPIHHEGKPLDDAAASVLVARVRASAVRATSAALDDLATALPEPIVSMSLRSVMYRQMGTARRAALNGRCVSPLR
jgi:hypothetical protein